MTDHESPRLPIDPLADEPEGMAAAIRQWVAEIGAMPPSPERDEALANAREARLAAAQVVLEEVMGAAINSARAACAEAAAGDSYAAGKVDAYYDVLDVFKEQAEVIGLEFFDATLRDIDPDELLRLIAKLQQDKRQTLAEGMAIMRRAVGKPNPE